MIDYLDHKREHLIRGEGSISHMYLDTVGLVTVGVGNMLSDAVSAAALPFVRRSTGSAANAFEIEEEFDLVRALEKGMLAQRYEDFTSLDLPEIEIHRLLDDRIEEFESGLIEDFPGYESFPEEAQIGLLDMVFNLGRSGLNRKFPTFCRAAREQDWMTCAEECQRRGISDARNQETQELFESIS